jgi:aminopeptidase N
VRWSETYHAADGDSLRLVFFAYPEDEAAARIDYTVTHDALETFESLFGPYPFRRRSIGWEKLGVAEFPWGRGAMEHQTCISYGDGFITGDHASDWALVHEISHQWWGDALTPTSMEHIWLNEGFATYCQALFYEAQEGPVGYRRSMLRERSSVRLEYRGTIVRPEQYFNATVYRKGAWTLHMLRGVLGDETFFEALDRYYARYEHANASTEDFVRTAEETAGKDLRWFFLPWLYGTGRPEIAWDWWSNPVGGGHEVGLMIRQIQNGHPTYPNGSPSDHPPEHFSFPLEVRIFGDGDSTSQTVFIEGRTTFATLEETVPFDPDSIALDPDHWILREIEPRGEQLLIRPLTVYPNPATTEMRLTFQVPRPGRTRSTIYDIQGRRICELPDVETLGIHNLTWDGRNADGRRVGSGVYFVRVEGPGFTESARLVIAR